MSENLPSSDQIAFAEWFTKKSYSKDEKTCLLANRVMDREKALRSSLDAANATVTELFNAGEVARHERNEMAEKLAATYKERDEFAERLVQVASILEPHWRGASPKGAVPTAEWIAKEYGAQLQCLMTDNNEELEAANRALAEAREQFKIDYREVHKAKLRDESELAREISARLLKKQIHEREINGLNAQLTEVRAKLEAAEKERDAAIRGTEKHQLDWGIEMRSLAAQLTAAQADVAQLTEKLAQANEQISCLVSGPNCAALTASASREAALVDALRKQRSRLLELANRRGGPTWDVFTKNLRREAMHWIPDIDAALARCSPPAAETETGTQHDAWDGIKS